MDQPGRFVARHGIAITGCLAAGKSTVRAILAHLGYPTVDADDLARALTQPQEAGWQRIREGFGPDYFLPDQTLHRRKLRERIFSDVQARRKLEAMLHPLIWELLLTRAAALEVPAWHPVFFYEASLIYETQTQDRFLAVMVVCASQKERLRRLQQGRGFSLAEAHEGMAAQMPQAQKAQQTPWRIDTSVTYPWRGYASLEEQVQGVVGMLPRPDKLR